MNTDYKIIDFPFLIKKEIYETYIQKYIERVKNIEGLLAIYQIGSISVEGISDIDLVVVVEDNFNVTGYRELSARRVFANDNTANYLFNFRDRILSDLQSAL